MASIDEIIRQSAPGDPRLFEALMVGHYNTIYRLTNAVLQDSDEADDAAQETFIQAAAHITDYQPGTNIKSWLAKIAVNLCRDKLRRKKTRLRLLNTLKLLSWQGRHTTPSPEDAVIGSERKRIIHSVIDSLDEKHRLPILLRYMQGMTVVEIAEGYSPRGALRREHPAQPAGELGYHPRNAPLLERRLFGDQLGIHEGTIWYRSRNLGW